MRPLGTVPFGSFLTFVPLGTVPFGPFVNLFNYSKGAWVPPFFVVGVLNNCSRNGAKSGKILYICGWRLGCCIRLTSGSWLRSGAALSGSWGFWGLTTEELTL